MAAASASTMPSLRLASGTKEALKWLALALMLLDHVNAHVLHGSQPWAFAAGRVVMPIFGAVLAHNLAHGDEAAAWRAVRRCLAFGALATPAFWALHGGWWPLNILFELAAAAAVIALVQRRRFLLAAVLFLLAGSTAEFWWPGIGATVAAWCWWRRPSFAAAASWAVALALLSPINGNAWAFGALPILALAAQVDIDVPRLRWFFYAAYPAHLAILWMWSLR